MEVSHTTDGYLVLSGYIDREHEDAQAIMSKAKQEFVKANPLVDSSRVVIVNGEFKQASPDKFTLGDMARTDECRSLTHDMIAAMTNDTKVKEMLG
ncbi:hypothetical protein [Lactiplantibacillus plantarum]|uniref:hypothetical protein n=1 Tax=Lactiplantibacillus plantarum TaxID=1590 RepID=UPI0032189861